MSSYPDTIAANEAQGPSLGSLKVAYFEEHGFMPGPELDKELLDKYWEAMLLGQEGITEPSSHNTDQAQQPHHLHHQQQQQQQIRPEDGHLKLVQRRLDLAPFFGPSPVQIYGGPLRGPWPAPVPGLISDPLTPPVLPAQMIDPSLYKAAGATNYGVPNVGPAAFVSDHDARFLNKAFPVHENSTPVRVEAAPATPQSRRSYKAKDPWTQSEIDRVVYLREKEHKNWVEIQEDLGTHTTGSIADKYWQVVRLSKGLKK